MIITIDIPDDATSDDLKAASGAIIEASTSWVDWEILNEDGDNAIGAPGRILLAVARGLSII